MPLEEIVDFSPEISGAHSMYGVLIMTGPDIKSNERLKDPTVFDVAPTIFALRRMPIPRDVDGRVLAEAFTEKIPLDYIVSYDSQAERTKLSTEETLTKHEEDYIKRKLKELGYL